MNTSTNFQTWSSQRLFKPLLALLGTALFSQGDLFADGVSFLPPRNEDVITVTDFTPDGSLLPVPTPRSPVYYEACSLGFRELGRSMAGEQPPKNDLMLALIVKTLAQQG